jgi:hypothetical protein
VTAVLTITALPASANPVELFFQDLEGVYSATWFGSLVSKDAGISANVHVVADGKISFDGTVKLSCYQGDYSYDWIYVDPDMFTSDSVPPNVIVKARDVFC